MVPIVWTGLGLLIVPLLMGAGLVGAVVLESLVGPIGTTVGLLISAVLLVVVGRTVNRDGHEHSLYGIPVQHWAWIQGLFVVLSVVFMLAA
ncbi:hypothetical protein [Nonomuraea rubra]|uniref:hypothetical protein n=1 Tax=Nonomuraea rubra TaxID=46180 RepID=UPI00340B9760